MTEFPISGEALEAATKALAGSFQSDPAEICRAGINAFLAAEGFEVQKTRVMGTKMGESDSWDQRLVGPWRPSEGQ